MEIDRRQFVKKASVTAAVAGMFTIIPSSVWSSKTSPSDKINVGLIGTRNFGSKILRDHLGNDDVNCVAMCDVDANMLQERAAAIRDNFDQNPKLYSDFRKLLEQKDIDAVIIGTPDHWHCLNFVYALQAGKDVYVEKPLANTIGECDIMVKAAKRYNERVVQVGQQQRSGRAFIEPMQLIKSGAIGKLRKVNIWANFNYGIGAEPAENSPVPDGLDYDFWLGPAPYRPYNRARLHGSWRHFWDYGGGLFSDWGVHLIDMGLWATDLLDAPDKVMTYAADTSKQNRMRETFDTMNVIYPKKDHVINFDLTAGVQDGPWERPFGLAFVGDDGTIVVNRAGYRVYPEWDNNLREFRAEAKSVTDLPESHPEHVRNFLDCIKTREKPVCTPEIGRAAAIHVHIPNIAARVGENILLWDDKNSRFTNSEKANQLITPTYRAPWVLPSI
jgi:predicted dehydrogenase